LLVVPAVVVVVEHRQVAQVEQVIHLAHRRHKEIVVAQGVQILPMAHPLEVAVELLELAQTVALQEVMAAQVQHQP
jgi:hypothetical protein